MALSRLIPIAAYLAVTLPAQQAAPPSHPRLTYDRIFGGSNADTPTSITTDLQANVIVAGTTDSVNFPTTPGSYKPAAPAPLLARQSDSQTFQPVPFDLVQKVNVINFSISGSIGYADATAVSGADAIYRTSDGGHTWRATAANLPYLASSLVIDPSTPSTVYAVTPLGLYLSTNAGDTWAKLNYPEIRNSPPSFLAIDPTNSKRLFLVLGYMPSQVLRSLDAGATWQVLTTSPYYNPAVISIDPNQPNLIYSVGSFENVFRSQDGGDTWSQLLPGTSPSFVGARLSVDSSSILYVATSKGIYKSADQGQTYTLIPTPAPYLNNFQIDPLDSSHFVVSTGIDARTTLFETHDAGGTWTQLSPVAAIVSGFAVRGNSLFAITPPGRQVFVTKWNSLAGTIVASTYLGPSQIDFSPKVVADRDGYIYVSGETSASGFPVSPGAFFGTPGPTASRPGFVTKLTPDLSQIVWSTLIPAGVSDLQVDAAGNVYLAGSSCQPDFPATTLGSTPTSYTLSCGPNPGGGYLAKLNSSGTAIVYAKYLADIDTVSALALDASGSVYLTGALANRTGPGFNGTVPRGPSYIAKVSPAGDKLVNSAKLSADTSANAIALTPTGDVLITGATNTPLFSGLVFPFQPTPAKPTCSLGTNAYVLRTTADLVFTAFSFLGDGCEEGRSVQSDRSGNIWVSGYSLSKDFPQVFGFQPSGWGFVAKLTPLASGLLFSSKVDYAPQLNVSREDSVFLASSTGRTGSLTKTFSESSLGGTALLTRIDP